MALDYIRLLCLGLFSVRMSSTISKKARSHCLTVVDGWLI